MKNKSSDTGDLCNLPKDGVVKLETEPRQTELSSVFSSLVNTREIEENCKIFFFFKFKGSGRQAFTLNEYEKLHTQKQALCLMLGCVVDSIANYFHQN